MQAQNNDLQKKIQTQKSKKMYYRKKTPKKKYRSYSKKNSNYWWTSEMAYTIKKIYPDWIFIKGEQGENIPSPDLEKTDAIFFYTKHMSHGLYQRYVSQCRNKAILFII